MDQAFGPEYGEFRREVPAFLAAHRPPSGCSTPLLTDVIATHAAEQSHARAAERSGAGNLAAA